MVNCCVSQLLTSNLNGMMMHNTDCNKTFSMCKTVTITEINYNYHCENNLYNNGWDEISRDHKSAHSTNEYLNHRCVLFCFYVTNRHR